jgi:hypothetical protein
MLKTEAKINRLTYPFYHNCPSKGKTTIMQEDLFGEFGLNW